MRPQQQRPFRATVFTDHNGSNPLLLRAYSSAILSPVSPKYIPEVVERVMLEEVIQLHPRRLTIDALMRRVIGDPADGREVETAREAIRDLEVSGVIRQQDDRTVAATPAVLRTFALLLA
jgi:hypothetical protein